MVIDYRKMPGPMILIPEQSSEMVAVAAHAQLSVVETMMLGISPIAVQCDEAWKPILELAAAKFAYCWEWVSDPLYDDSVLEPWQKCPGSAVLKKV